MNLDPAPGLPLRCPMSEDSSTDLQPLFGLYECLVQLPTRIQYNTEAGHCQGSNRLAKSDKFLGECYNGSSSQNGMDEEHGPLNGDSL